MSYDIYSLVKKFSDPKIFPRKFFLTTYMTVLSEEGPTAAAAISVVYFFHNKIIAI